MRSYRKCMMISFTRRLCERCFEFIGLIQNYQFPSQPNTVRYNRPPLTHHIFQKAITFIPSRERELQLLFKTSLVLKATSNEMDDVQRNFRDS